MATRDFRSQQIRTTQLIASGSDPTTTPSLLIYSASATTNDQGGMHTDLLSGAGEDAWMFVSGSTRTADGEQVLFGGNIAVSGSVTGSEISSFPDAKLEIRSDHEMNFHIDMDANQTSEFGWFTGPTTQVATLDESGNLALIGSAQISSTHTSGIGVIKNSASEEVITIDGDQNTYLSGTLTIPSDIIHDGDTDTKISFAPDVIKIEAGGEEFVRFAQIPNTATTFNWGGGSAPYDDINFTVNSKNKSGAIFVNAGQDTVKFLDNNTNDLPFHDVNFYVAGTVGNKDTVGGTRGTALFAGDLVVSGTLYAEKQVMEVDLSQKGNLIMTGAVHFDDSGAAYGSTLPVPEGDGAIWVSTGSLYAKLAATPGGVTSEIKIGQKYIPGNGLTETVLDPNTTFHMSIAALTGSALSANDLRGPDLLAIADVSEDDDRTRAMTLDNFALDLARRGIRSAVDVSDGPGFITDDGIVAHLTGAIFAGSVGITGSHAGYALSTVGKVGVGVADPDAQLEVFSAHSPQFKVSRDAAEYLQIGVEEHGDVTKAIVEVYQADSSAGRGTLTFRANHRGTGKDVLTLVAAGSGISTLTGSLIFRNDDATDDGYVQIDPDHIYANRAKDSDLPNPQFNLRRARGSNAAPTVVQDGDILGDIGFWGHDGNGYELAAKISAKVSGTPADDTTDMPGMLVFSTSPDGTDSPIDHMSITPLGKVGIGTTAPGTRLQIDSTQPYITLKNKTAENTDGGAESKIIFEDHSDASLAEIEAAHDGSADDTKGRFRFKVNTGSGLANALTISSDQDVQIGGDLTVVGGDIRGPTDGSLTIKADTDLIFKIDNDGDGTETFQFQNGSGNEVASLDESGNLQVDGTVSAAGTATITGANDAAAIVELKADNSDDAGDDWTITANADQTFTIGNDIASAGTAVSHVVITPNATVTNSTVDVKGKLKIGSNTIQNADAEDTIILDADQRVGIGGISPSYKLDVDGDIRVRGNDIRDNSGNVAIGFDGSANTTIGGTLTVPSDIIHTGDVDTKISFHNDEDRIKIRVGDVEAVDIRESAGTSRVAFNNSKNQHMDFKIATLNKENAFRVDSGINQVKVLSGSDVATSKNSFNEAGGLDVGFYVSGSTGTLYGLGTPNRGISVFGGDVVVSGSLYGADHRRIDYAGIRENGSFSTTPIASSTNSIAIGNDAQANTGTGAYAIGNKTRATGQNSIALGSANGNNVASGISAAALGGEDVNARGDYSVAIGGANNQAGRATGGGHPKAGGGDYAIAMGQSVIVGGDNAIGIGKSLTVDEDNSIAIGNGAATAKIALSGSVEAFGTLTVPGNIEHTGDNNTKIVFDTDRISFHGGGGQLLNLRKDGDANQGIEVGGRGTSISTTIFGGLPASAVSNHSIVLPGASKQVLVMSGGHSTSVNEAAGLDVAFYVSGSQSSKDSATERGVAVFGGDLHISGGLSGPTSYSFVDNNVRMFRDGNSLKFDDGENTVKTLSELASIGASTTHFVGVHGGTPATAKLKATGSIAFAGADDNFVDGLQAKGVGQDVFVFFSGSIGAKAGWDAAGANQFKTDGRAVTLFGGDCHFSGTTGFTNITAAADVRANGSLIAGGNLIKNSGGHQSVKFNSADQNVLFGSNAGLSNHTNNALSLVDIRSDDNTVLASGGNGNTFANYNLALRNHSDTTNAFAGIAFDVTDQEDADTIGASIAAVRDADADSNNHDLNLVFMTNDAGDDGLTERVRITHDGKVGIGTNNPSTSLHISGLDSIVVPVGTTAQRGTATQGGIRYNTTTSVFEGYNGSSWASLGETKDVDQDTYVRAETSAGSDNDDLVFVTNGTQRASIDNAGVFAVTGSFEAQGAFSALHNSGITVGADADGNDRKIVFGHSTIKSIIGIDDDTDTFQIHTNGDFHSSPDIGINAGGDVTIGNGNLIIDGGEIRGTPSGQLKLYADTNVCINIDVDNSGTDALFKVQTNSQTTKFEITEAGHVQMDGDLTVSGNDIKDSGDNTVLSFDGSGNVSNNVSFSGAPSFSGTPTFGQYIAHTGDPDTRLKFNTDAIWLEAGGSGFIGFVQEDSNPNYIVINEAGSDHDFRIETLNEPNMFFVDGSTDRIGINFNSPAADLHLKGDFRIKAQEHSNDIMWFYDDQGASNAGVINLRAAGSGKTILHATGSSFFAGNLGINHPSGSVENSLVVRVDGNDGNDGMLIMRQDGSAVADGELLGGIGFDSSDGAVPSSITEASAFIAAYAAEAHASTDKGGDLVFGTTLIDDNENVVSHERMRILDSGKVGIGVSDPDSALEILNTGAQLKLSYDGSNSAQFTVDSAGGMMISPSGDKVTIAASHTLGAAGAGVLQTYGALTTHNSTVNRTDNNTEAINFATTSITLAESAARISTVRISEPNISLNGKEVGRAASLYVDGAPTEGTGYRVADDGVIQPSNAAIWAKGDIVLQDGALWVDAATDPVSSYQYEDDDNSIDGILSTVRSSTTAADSDKPKAQTLLATFDGKSTSTNAISITGRRQTTPQVRNQFLLNTSAWTGANHNQWSSGWNTSVTTGIESPTKGVLTYNNIHGYLSQRGATASHYSWINIPLWDGSTDVQQNTDTVVFYILMKITNWDAGSSDKIRIGPLKTDQNGGAYSNGAHNWHGTTTVFIDNSGSWSQVATTTNSNTTNWEPIDDGMSNGVWTWVKVECTAGDDDLDELNYIQIWSDAGNTGSASPTETLFLSNAITEVQTDANYFLADSTNGAANGLRTALVVDSTAQDGNDGASGRALMLLMAKGDGTSFKTNYDATKPMQALPDADRFVIQWSYDNGTNWVTPAKKFFRYNGTGTPPELITSDKSDWTELATNGVIAGSEFEAGGWQWYTMPLPQDVDADISQFKIRFGVDDEDSDATGVAINSILTYRWNSEGVKMHYDSHAFYMQSYYGAQDFVFRSPQYSNESANIDWLKWDASEESIIVPALEIKCNANTATGGTNTPGLKITDSNSTDHWDIYIGSSGDSHLNFRPSGTTTNGGYMNSQYNRSDFTFTGQHRNRPGGGVEINDFADKIGYIVVSNGEYNNIMDDNKPQINESLPCVELSSARNQKSVFGVISELEDSSDTRAWSQGAWVSTWEKESGDDRMHINSLGEGGIWVTNINGNLENGDYITTCEIPGLGMKQDDDLLHNYTVAKITQDCNFRINSTKYDVIEFEHDGQTYRKAFVGCTYHCG